MITLVIIYSISAIAFLSMGIVMCAQGYPVLSGVMVFLSFGFACAAKEEFYKDRDS